MIIMKNKAMTIIEVMISILLIGIVLSAIIVLIPQVMVNDQKSIGVITATSIAQDRLEYAEKYTFRNLHELVETDESITQNNMEFKRTTMVGYEINSVDTVDKNKFTDTDQNWTTTPTPEWQYYIVTIASGTAKGKHYQISSNTNNTITCDGANFITDGLANNDYYYIGLAPVEVTVAYKVTLEATILPFKKSSGDIGLQDSPADVTYKHIEKWQNVIFKTILVENE